MASDREAPSTSAQSNDLAPVGYLVLLRRNPDFRNLWIGQIVSFLGDWFNLIASAALVAMLTQSGLAVGALFVVRMLAQFVGSTIGGVLADRYNRKALLILTDLLRTGIVLGFLFVQDPADVWLLYLLTAAQLMVSGIFVPTRDAIIPDIVRKNEIGAANALGAATWSTMFAIGAALGGLVAGQWGLRPAFVIDSLTFVFSAILIARVRYHKTTLVEDDAVRKSAFLSEYVEGLRYLKEHRGILVLALQKASMALGVTSVYPIIQVTLASQVYVIGEGGSTSLGIFFATVGIGTGVGPILARRFTGDDEVKLRRAMALSYLFSAAGLLIVSSLGGFGVVLAGNLIRGFGNAVNWVFSTQLLLHLVPSRVRGRVFSTEFALMTLINALGAGVGGWMLDNLAITIPQILWGMTAVTLLLGGFWVINGLTRSSPSTETGS